MKKPLVSIVIPTKDRKEALKRLLQSIEESTYANVEVLIVNDSPKPLSGVKGQKCVIINNESTRGLAYSRTQGARKSNGDLVLFIDDDNVIEKNMIENMVETMNVYPFLLAVGPATYYLTNKNKIWFIGSKLNLLTTIPAFKRSYEDRELIDGRLIMTENLHNCFMVRKNVGDAVSWFDELVYMNGTEFDLFQRAKKVFPEMSIATDVTAKCFHDVPEFHKNFLRSLGFENTKRVYYFQRNRGLHVGRHGTLLDKLCLFFFFYPLFLVVYSLLFIYYRRSDFFVTHIRATVDGYKMIFGGFTHQS